MRQDPEGVLRYASAQPLLVQLTVLSSRAQLEEGRAGWWWWAPPPRSSAQAPRPPRGQFPATAERWAAGLAHRGGQSQGPQRREDPAPGSCTCFFRCQDVADGTKGRV